LAPAQAILAKEPTMIHRHRPSDLLLWNIFSLPWSWVVLGPLLLALAGCDLMGVAANSVSGQQDIKAAYGGLKGQKVGIMVWADEAIMADHPRVETDIAAGLQDKLTQAADAGTGEVKDIQWTPPHEVERFQEAHPELQAEPPQQLAPHLPVTRLIYIELVSLSLHPNDSVDLWRGAAVANVRVVEVVGSAGTVAYTEDSIQGSYPPHAPPEGMPGLSDDAVYRKTIDNLTTELAKRFITHEADAQ
jgi:hypothetical protein